MLILVTTFCCCKDFCFRVYWLQEGGRTECRRKYIRSIEIREIVAPIAKQHGVDKVFLFGSYARGDATPASDVDLCVDAPKLRGLFALGGLYADLEDALKKSIDVVTTGSLKYNKDKAFLENLRKDRVLLYELS